MSTLWSANTPERFWQCQLSASEADWAAAIAETLPQLECPVIPCDIDAVLAYILGEGRFGPDRWNRSPSKKLYYVLKPILPGIIRRVLRQAHVRAERGRFEYGWPIETLYARLQWEVMRNLLITTNSDSVLFKLEGIENPVTDAHCRLELPTGRVAYNSNPDHVLGPLTPVQLQDFVNEQSKSMLWTDTAQLLRELRQIKRSSGPYSWMGNYHPFHLLLIP